MWREGGTKTSSEEHHFTSLSSFLSLPSFSAPFVVPPDGSKKKVANVFISADFSASVRLLVSMSATIFGNFCDALKAADEEVM